MVDIGMGGVRSSALGGRIGVGDVYSHLFATVGRYWRVFFALSLLLAVFGLQGFAKPYLPARSFAGLNGAALVVRTLLATLVQAGLTYATVQALSGAPFSVQGGLRTGLRRFFPYLGASILYILAIVFGAMLLVVPGVIAFAMLTLAPALSVIERTGPIESQSRSRALTRGNRWRILAVVVPVYFVPGVILSAIGFSMARTGHATGNALLLQ